MLNFVSVKGEIRLEHRQKPNDQTNIRDGARSKKVMHHWLVKSEPSVYSWQHLVKDGRTRWDGVRNFEARNNLRSMKKGDLLLFYHSGDNKEIVGVAKVAREAYPDPTAKGEDWSAVDLEPSVPLSNRVSLSMIKSDPVLSTMVLVRKSRLSVIPVTHEEYRHILTLSKSISR